MALETALETSSGRRPTRLVARPHVVHVPPESRGAGAVRVRGWRGGGGAWIAPIGGAASGETPLEASRETARLRRVCAGGRRACSGSTCGKSKVELASLCGKGSCEHNNKSRAQHDLRDNYVCSSPMSQLISMSLGPCLWVGVSGASHLISQRADRPHFRDRPRVRHTVMNLALGNTLCVGFDPCLNQWRSAWRRVPRRRARRKSTLTFST